MAGLPYHVNALLAGESTSFLRRTALHRLGSVPPYEVREAFRLTVACGGREIEDDALDGAVDIIGGFPCMFQLLGYRSWNATGAGDTIGAAWSKNSGSATLPRASHRTALFGTRNS